MLGRKHDLGRFGGLAVFVADRDLALGIGAELADVAGAGVTRGGEQFQDLVAVVERGRHEVRRFRAGVTEHDALVAGTLVALLVGGIVDALGDVWRLAVQEDVDLGRLPVETGLLVADLAYGLARGGLELRRIDERMTGGIHDQVALLVLLQQRQRNADFAGDDDAIRGGQRFAGDADFPRVHAGLSGFAINQINDLVRNAVANLVRMTFGNRFRSKEVILPHSGCPL